MLCGQLREKSTCILILLLCLITVMVASLTIASERPATGIQGIETPWFISNHRMVASKRIRKYINNQESEGVDKKHPLKDISDGRDWQMKQSAAMLYETVKSNLLGEEVVSSQTRQKRSFGFEIVSDGIIPEGASFDMKTSSAQWKPARKLYHQSSSTLLQILPNGDITGTTFFNKYCILLLKSVDHVDNKTLTKIFGNSTGRYIAMTSKGVLYTTKDPQNKETNFLHEYAPATHDAYISQAYRRYITLSGSNGHSSPRKARRVVKGSRTPKRSRFLLVYVSEADVRKAEKEKSPVDSHPAKNGKRHRKCRKRKNTPCRRKSRLRKTKHRRRGKTRKKHQKGKSDHAILPDNSKQNQNRGKIKTASDHEDVS